MNGVMLPQAKEHQGLLTTPGVRRGEGGFPHRNTGGSMALHTP